MIGYFAEVYMTNQEAYMKWLHFGKIMRPLVVIVIVGVVAALGVRLCAEHRTDVTELGHLEELRVVLLLGFWVHSHVL
jgi:hypothetical protein